MATIRINAAEYQDHDDCLRAAAEEYAAEHALEGWDLEPRWENNQRDTILLTVPTTVENLTVYQVHALQVEAERAGDTATASDCHTVDAAYWLSSAGDLQGALSEHGPEVREAAARIVAAIRNAEGQA